MEQDAPDGRSLIARQLGFLRRQRGWSQRELARRADLHQPDISRIEAGSVTPNEATIVRLASSLGYRLTLVPEDESTSRQSEDSESADMDQSNWQNRIWSDPGKRSGQPVIRGMRITVRDILEYLAGGMTPEEIVDDFPELELEDISASLAYAAAHLQPMPA